MSDFKTITDLRRRLQHWAVRLLGVLSIAALQSACALHGNDLVPDQDKVGVPVTAIGHYGAMIGIPEYSINGFHGGNNSGWGGGGSTACCVLLPRTVTKPVIVTVKWETCDISHIQYVNHRKVDPDARCTLEGHEATVPIHFAVQPGEGAGLKVHFLPGHKVEVWYTRQGPTSAEYPGPKFPFGPAPPYAPLPDEKPALPTDNSTKK
ncbi:DUF3304 domain-containing protein [Variovorax ginsengisoli]|uniref:DUF3304 domain-containing protein n=1 Tax=Variovorax ginsengisoli TaxID=363844 RepID=A0ABT9SE78_9BURK|nr:DUF3304 domain-containing protein [Variovorax ginsengisoli]MDP9902510.1 hypothetical protein [Variovorax ginsengisoli]